MADKPNEKEVIASADDAAVETSDEESHEALANMGPEMPRSMRRLAEKLPEKDEVQKAYKKQMLADDMQVAAKEKVKIVKASPDADETPSGKALMDVAGIAHDADRGEAYQRARAGYRHGWLPVEDES
jgi:hypothetical protein